METATVDTVQSLLDAHPDIPIDLPIDATNNTLHETYNLYPTTLVPENTTPLAIARPQTAAQVAQLVRYAAQRGLPVTVRSGGHDSHRRSMASGALVLDIRALNSVRISEDRRRATIGGGVTTGALTAVLEPAGLATTYPAVASVGYVGWATTGGYGLMNGRYGLGVDQIVGARVVNARGEIVEADDELLSALRGGGAGSWGVVVEMDVRVYEADKVQVPTPQASGTTWLTYLGHALRGNRIQRPKPRAGIHLLLPTPAAGPG